MQNQDFYFMKKDVCPVCGRPIYEWEHVEILLPSSSIKVHKECGVVLKHKRKLMIKRRDYGNERRNNRRN